MTSKYFNIALLFNEALIELLKIKEFDYITIKELCNKAGFNRSTFYLHYESTNDVLEECIELINQRFIEKFNMKVNLKTLKKEELNFIDESYLRPYLEFVKENLTIFKAIREYPNLFKVNSTYLKMKEEIFKPILLRYDIKENEADYVLTYFINGLISIIIKWVDRDCYDDISDIINIIKVCIYNEKSSN